MSGSVRIYLRGHFQCSPDDFQAQMCDVDVSSDTLLSRINEGYTVIGAVAQTSNAKELAATTANSAMDAISALRELVAAIDKSVLSGVSGTSMALSFQRAKNVLKLHQ